MDAKFSYVTVRQLNVGKSSGAAMEHGPVMLRRLKLFLIVILSILSWTPISAGAQTNDTNNLLNLDLKDGRVTIRLRPDLAPKHVSQIRTLVTSRFYDGIVFHRVIAGFMAQTGDPTGTGKGGSKLPNLAAEFTSAPFVRGTVGMARAQSSDSANSQFFITYGNVPSLNGQYTVFGEVVSGIEFVDNIKKGDPNANGSVQSPDRIIRAYLGNASSPIAAAPVPTQASTGSNSEAAFQAFLNKSPDGTPHGTRPTNFQFVVSTNDSKHFTALNLKPPSNATYANPNVFVGCGNQEYDNVNPDKTKLTGINIEDGKFYLITAQSAYFAPTDTAAGESKRDGKYLISFESCKMEPFTPAAADVARLRIAALKNQYAMMYLGPTFKCPDFKCGTLGSLIMDQSYINEHLGRTDIELYQPVQALRHAYPEQRNVLRDQLSKELKNIEQSCRLPTKFGRDPLGNLSGTEKFGACVKSAYSKLRATMVAQGSSYGSTDMREEIARSVSDHVFGQVLLKHFEFLPKTADVDGSFGQGTRTAIMAAQAEANLDQSGFLSNATYDFLINRVVAQARTKNDVAPQPIASVSATKNEPITSVKAPEGTGQKEVLKQKMMEFFELYKLGQKPTVKFANIRTLGECGIAYENLDPNSQRVSAENTQGFKNLRVKMGETINHPEKSIRNFADEKPYYVEFPSADGPNSGFKIAGLDGSPNLSDGLVFAKNTEHAAAFVKVLSEITALCAGKPLPSTAHP